MRRPLYFAVTCSAALVALAAHATEPRIVHGKRIVLSDVVPSAPVRLRPLDLGPAPPPGGTRLVTIDDVQRRLRQIDEDPNAVDYREAVRVVSAVRTIEPQELAKLVEPAIQAALPQGVVLVQVAPSIPIKTTPRAAVGRATLPPLPRRVGQTLSTAVVELMDGAVILARIPVPVTLNLSDVAARADLARGSSVRVFFESGLVKVSTQGELLTDANVGDFVSVAVRSTRRVVRAQLLTVQNARVVP